MQALLRRQQDHFHLQLRETTWRQRVKKLKRIKAYLFAHREELIDALAHDLRRAPLETEMVELLPLLSELKHTIRHLDLWMKPRRVKAQLPLWGSKSWICPEGKGSVLVIAPWNYPVMLALGPAISAIAAGNAVVIKPSEHTPHSAAFVAQLIRELFDPAEVAVVQGDHETAAALTHLRFDHIFFTGSPEVGRLVMKAAAPNLTPVTLELGGLNPVIVDEKANLRDAAKRIIWGKLINNGQSCVAPDYVLVHQRLHRELLTAMKETIDRFLGNDWKKSPDLVRMVNARHLARVKALLDAAIAHGAKVWCGGEHSEAELYLAPTLLTSVSEDNPVMQEEIFGPLLPVLPYSTDEEALAIIRRKEAPLALYLFSRSRKKLNWFSARIASGTVVWNETKIQFANPGLPFGGVGVSGMGKGHGEFGFREFSNERAWLHQRRGITTVQLFFPPYSSFKQKMLRLVSRIF